jgi:hypothetical protein
MALHAFTGSTVQRHWMVFFQSGFSLSDSREAEANHFSDKTHRRRMAQP